MKKPFALAFVVLLGTPSAHAQVTVDVAKITCDQFLVFSVADPRDISIWLSGYHHGKHDSRSFEPQQFKANFEKLKSACLLRENAKLPVMQVVEKTLGDKK